MSNPVQFVPFHQPTFPTNCVGEPNCPQPVGFAGVGKLTGHTRQLFQAALCVFYEFQILHPSPMFSYFNQHLEEIYCHIPPEMRLAIVAELSIGLLVPDQPLPVDSVLNHAVYFHLMWDCVLEGIRSEIEIAPPTKEEKAEELARMKNHMKNFRLDSLAEEAAAEIKSHEFSAIQLQQQKKKKKKNKKLRKKMMKEEETNKEGMLASLQAAADARKYNGGTVASTMVLHTEILQTKKEADLAADPSRLLQYSLPMNRSPVHGSDVIEYPSDFIYRGLLRNVIIFETGFGNLPPGTVIPSLDEKHFSCWNAVFSLWTCYDPRMNDSLLMNLPIKSRLLVMEYVPKDDDGTTQLQRIELMNRELDQVQPEFEKSWTQGRGLFALRAIQLLCGVQHKYGHVLCGEIFHRKRRFQYLLGLLSKTNESATYKSIADDYTTRIASPAFQSVGWQDKEHIQLQGKMCSGSIWIDTFWSMLEEHHDGASSINDFNAVHDALLRSTFESDVAFGMYVAPMDFDPVEIDEIPMETVFGNPKDKRMHREKEGLKVYACANCSKRFGKNDNGSGLCSGCRLVRYCSRDCQRAHWSVGIDGNKSHKTYCKIMRKAAAKAT